MGKNGTDVLILVNTGTDAAPVWTPVGSQRDSSIEESSDMIDVSSKDSRARKILPGRYSATLSLNALYVPDHVSYTLLKDAMRNGTPIQVMKQDDGSDIEKATGYVGEMSEEFPDQGEATISITIEIDGEWVAVGGTP